MPNMNFLVFLNSFSDSNPSNNPSLSNVKWDREINGLPVSNPSSQAYSLAPGETKQLFNGVRTLSLDNTSQFSLDLVPLSSNNYQLSWVGGTNPVFRTARAPGADATTQVSVTINGPLATFASTAGTPFALISGGVVVGDYVRIGNLFNQLNQGEFKIVSLTATSFTVVNELGTAEGPITLGSGFASQVQIYSAQGVQVGDTLVISGGFSPVSQGSYKVTAVSASWIQFYSTDVLPQEDNIATQALAVYSAAKQLVYLEADQPCSVSINGSQSASIRPIVINNSVSPGVFLNTASIWSMSVTNNGTDPASVFLVAAE